MIRVKICGITNSRDALKAASLGAWAVGFVFYKKSPRSISPFKVKKIIAELPPFVTSVGLFVNQNERAVKDIAQFCGIQTLQFHGDESPEYCGRFRGYKIIKAFRVDEKFTPETLRQYSKVNAFLFDAFQEGQFGGTGSTFDWSLLKAVKNFNRPVILSGGLNAANISEAIAEVRPFAVDVSSGVEESPGQKSERLLEEFFIRVYL